MTLHLHIDSIVLNGRPTHDVNRIASVLREAAVPEHVLLDVAHAVAQASLPGKEDS